MEKRVKVAKRVSDPDFLHNHFDCTVCGGRYKVTRHTTILDVKPSLGCVCPYCRSVTVFENDIHKNYKRRLLAFVHSQVAPIKAIQDDKIRVSMAKLLDAFHTLLQD